MSGFYHCTINPLATKTFLMKTPIQWICDTIFSERYTLILYVPLRWATRSPVELRNSFSILIRGVLTAESFLVSTRYDTKTLGSQLAMACLSNIKASTGLTIHDPSVLRSELVSITCYHNHLIGIFSHNENPSIHYRRFKFLMSTTVATKHPSVQQEILHRNILTLIFSLFSTTFLKLITALITLLAIISFLPRILAVKPIL